MLRFSTILRFIDPIDAFISIIGKVTSVKYLLFCGREDLKEQKLHILNSEVVMQSRGIPVTARKYDKAKSYTEGSTGLFMVLM